MTLPPHQVDELLSALESYLAQAGACQPPDPELWISAHELHETLKSGAPDEDSCRRTLAAAAENLAVLRSRLGDLRHEREILAGLIIKNREVADQMQEKLVDEQNQANEAWQSFTIARKLVSRQGDTLQKSLENDLLEKLISRKLDEMLFSPTTGELTQAMQSLLDQAAALFDKSQRKIRQIGELVDAIYARFSVLPGRLPQVARPQPNLAAYHQSLLELTASASEFCRRPMNLMTDKASLVKKFGLEVVLPLRSLFAKLQAETLEWLKEPCTGLQGKLQDEKIRLEKRQEDIAKIRDYLATLEARIAETETELAQLSPSEETTARIVTILDQP
jgi:hypothetical protein